MINNQTIKGEYCFDANVYTMFDVYHIHTKDNNLITNDGIDFFLNKCVVKPTIIFNEETEDYELEDTYGYIGYIGVGTSTVEPSESDNSLFEQSNIFYDTDVKIKQNQIILTVETDGNSIDDTTEIGVYTTLHILISRDVHQRYSIPSTSTVKLTYKFTLNQKIENNEEEEEDHDD